MLRNNNMGRRGAAFYDPLPYVIMAHGWETFAGYNSQLLSPRIKVMLWALIKLVLLLEPDGWKRMLFVYVRATPKISYMWRGWSGIFGDAHMGFESSFRWTSAWRTLELFLARHVFLCNQVCVNRYSFNIEISSLHKKPQEFRITNKQKSTITLWTSRELHQTEIS